MANSSGNILLSRKVVVGLDFGTTYSGFAYAHVADPDNIYTYYDYPEASKQKPYCKTLTASYYKQPPGANPGMWELQSWGYRARKDWEQDNQALHRHHSSSSNTMKNDPSIQPTSGGLLSKLIESWSLNPATRHNSSVQPSVGVLLTKFKLHLGGESSAALPLPPGLTIQRVIADYLRELGGLILKHLQLKYGAHLTHQMVQWCITVPSIWDNSAKATMQSCMIAAGLVDGVHGSPHPLLIVLEPEAASFHCHKVMKDDLSLRVGNTLLVADIGGGTSDVVVHKVVNMGRPSYRVKELTTSLGGYCGGTYVDSRFIDFLNRGIGPCFSECIEKHPSMIGQLLQQWQSIKCGFGLASIGSDQSTYIDLPKKLVEEWESSDRMRGNPTRQNYDEFEINHTEMQSIFDPIVRENEDLIRRQLVAAGGVVEVLVLVGGFTESPYLVPKIRQTFASRVGSIVCPPNPGSAICQGAVALAFYPSTIVSRISKKAYGFRMSKSFQEGMDPVEYKEETDTGVLCRNCFAPFVRKGDEITVDESKTVICRPRGYGVKSLRIELYSYDGLIPPRYITGKSVKKEGTIVLDISRDMKLEVKRRIKVSLCFGGSFLEVKAEGVNFTTDSVRLPVAVDYLLG